MNIELTPEALRLLEQLDEGVPLNNEEIRQQIEEGWQAAQRGELVDGDAVFDRLDAKLAALERPAPK